MDHDDITLVASVNPQSGITASRCSGDDPSSSVLDYLQFVDFPLLYAIQQCITVIKTNHHKSMHKRVGSIYS